jgi:hypothetical protein
MAETTKTRTWGEDTDFLKWVRLNKLLPSREGDTRISVQDVDVIFHAFQIVVDSIGSRDVQVTMDVEVKCYGGRPDYAQRNTLWGRNLFTGSKKVNGITIIHQGTYFLFLDKTDPVNSRKMQWGCFNDDKSIEEKNIDEKTLIELLKFERDPRTMRHHHLRRHHLTGEIAIQVWEPLGFPAIHRIRHSS